MVGYLLSYEFFFVETAVSERTVTCRRTSAKKKTVSMPLEFFCYQTPFDFCRLKFWGARFQP